MHHHIPSGELLSIPMRKALGAWFRKVGYGLIHLAHRVDPVKGPFECPRCGGQGNVLVRSATGDFLRQTCAFCKGRGSVMDRRSGVDRRSVAKAGAESPSSESGAQPAPEQVPAPATKETGE
jgi:hypothetical protein